MNNGFCKILELHSELEQGIEFYSALLDKTAEQDSSINDNEIARSQLCDT